MYVSDSKLMECYLELKEKHAKYLEKYGVKFPRLKSGDNYTKDALVLIYLYLNFQKPVSKEDLTNFLGHYGERPNDVQQARHLGQQKGWYIISGQRHDRECDEYNVRPGEYALISVEKYYPNFTNLRRMDNLTGDEWESIKRQYNYRCATCGSIEGEPNIHYPNITTQLQKGHKDPNKSLEFGNIIPQCDSCNRQDRNNFVYNDKGRVIKIANPRFVLRSSKPIKKEIYDLLKEEFGNE